MTRLRWRELTLREKLWIYLALVVLLFAVGAGVRAVLDRPTSGGRIVTTR